MLRSLSAAALAAAAALCSFHAQAQHNVVLYGLVDASGSRSRPLGGSDYRWQLDSGNMSQSFVGFRGTEDLGGGLRGVFKLESYFGVDTGRSGRFDGDGFWGRDSNVGLAGAFGSTVLGRNVTPLYLTTVYFNPFGESFGFSPSTRQYFAGTMLGDRSWNNSLAYTNNPRDKLRVHLVFNTPEEAEGAPEMGHNYGASVSYVAGDLAAAVAFEKVKNSALPLPTGFQRQTAIQVSASYDFKFVRLYGQVGRIKTEAEPDSTTMLYHLGATVTFGTSQILIAYGRSQAKTSYSRITDQTYSLGYDYFLSKSADIYVAALYEKSFNVSSGSSVAGGVRLRF